MKKLAFAVLLLASCGLGWHNGAYVNHSISEYSVADDTIVVSGNIITERTGYQKLRHGHRFPRQFRTRRWRSEGFDVPVFEYRDGYLFWNQNVYIKIQ